MKLLKVFNSKKLRVAAMGSLSVKFLSAMFAFLNGVILARILEIEDFGIYILAFTTVNIFVVPTSLGFPELITRYVSKYTVDKNDAAIKGLLIKANTFVLYAVMVLSGIIVIAYFLWGHNYSESTVMTFLYGLILAPLLVFGSLRASSLRGLKLVILGEMPDTLIRNLLFCAILSVSWFFEYMLTPEKAMLMHVIAAFVAFSFGYLILKVKLLNSLRNVRPVYHTREWIREAIPFTITQWVGILKTKSITYILAFFGSLEAVALFDVAMRGATLVSFTLSALNSAISPFISSAFTQENMKSVQRMVTKSNRIVFVFALPAALAFIIGGKWLIGWVFGKEYVLSYIPLVILCVAQLVNALTGASGPILNMTGNQAYLSRNQVQMMILSLLLSVPLIIFYDTLGAALAFGLVLVVQNILLVLFIKKRLNINMFIF